MASLSSEFEGSEEGTSSSHPPSSSSPSSSLSSLPFKESVSSVSPFSSLDFPFDLSREITQFRSANIGNDVVKQSLEFKHDIRSGPFYLSLTTKLSDFQEDELNNIINSPFYAELCESWFGNNQSQFNYEEKSHLCEPPLYVQFIQVPMDRIHRSFKQKHFHDPDKFKYFADIADTVVIKNKSYMSLFEPPSDKRSKLDPIYSNPYLFMKKFLDEPGKGDYKMLNILYRIARIDLRDRSFALAAVVFAANMALCIRFYRYEDAKAIAILYDQLYTIFHPQE